MASSGKDQTIDIDALVDKFAAFGTKDKKMTSQAVGKLAKDCFGSKKVDGVDIPNVMDASAFGTMNGKARSFDVNKANVETFIDTTAVCCAKRKKPAAKNLTIGSDEAQQFKKQICAQILAKGPVLHATQTSKTGGVGRMTDASKYTGAHKERFGEDGKGKGMEGRKDMSKNTGYVGNYQGEGSYSTKK